MAERQVGIGSAAAALEPHARKLPNSVWVDITYAKPGGLIERMHLPGRLGGTLRGFQQSGAALRRGPYDALFFLTHNPAVLRQQAMGRTPTVLWTDVTPALLDAQASQYAHPVDKARTLRTVKHALVRRTFSRAALCVGWSEWARRSFVDDYGVPVSKTHVVPPGIDLARWSLPTGDKAQGLPHLLFVGGDFERKGGGLLLEVFRARLGDRAVLDIVTRDPVPEENNVRVHHGLTATSPELLSLYHSASVFVLPTRGDCFSIASMEAMATGLPVIVSAVGGIPDIVVPGETGYLVDPDDGRDLGDKLDALVANADLRRRMGLSGRARVEDRFDAGKSAERLFALFRSILGKD